MRSLLVLMLFVFSTSCSCQIEEKDYSTSIQDISLKKQEFRDIYESSDPEQKDSILTIVREYLHKTISKEVFPRWYGTPWDYNGTTRIPGEGSIACGYFVTTILCDVGFNIPRIKWAQSASEIFIKKLAPDDILRFSFQPIEDLSEYLQNSGDGLYLVGLDMHVGFINVEDSEMSFVHSNYYKPEIGVMSESIDSDNPLSNSKYRVIGKLLSDEMLIKWLYDQPYD